MKLNTTDFLRKCQYPLVLALGSIPVAVLLVMNIAPQLLGRTWLLPAVFVLLSWGCILLPGKRRLLGGIISAGALIALGVTLLEVPSHYLLAALPVIYAALLFVMLPIGGWDRSRELNVAWYVVFLVAYLFLQLLMDGSRKLGENLYAGAERLVLGCFLAFAVLVLLALNRASLDSAAMSRRKVPVLMRRQNLALTMGLMAAGLGIAAIPAIGSVLKKGWDLLMQVLGVVAGWLMAILGNRQGGAGGGPAGMPEDLGFGEYQEPSAFAKFMEKLILAVTAAAVTVLLFFVLRALIKRLIRLCKYLWSRWGQFSAAAGEDYEDEITDTRDEPEAERSSLLNRLRRMAPEDEKNMSPAERVRYRYKRLKHRRAWSKASTARETLPENAAALYERARYGGETLTEKEAGRFREDTRRI